ncbi:hypothetical protein AVEN_121835-1 [Araneus ventricosus]|uniref:Uncharacterized protein n=1 Tax=Araneus ventricosus TaxID=182803 RepID=A0A4Y2TNM4_ARAVE|nr:hypothetical protein AVEN_121835-1 [Araneus ventricosus]
MLRISKKPLNAKTNEISDDTRAINRINNNRKILTGGKQRRITEKQGRQPDELFVLFAHRSSEDTPKTFRFLRWMEMFCMRCQDERLPPFVRRSISVSEPYLPSCYLLRFASSVVAKLNR